MNIITKAEKSVNQQAQKYLTFALGDEEYGLEILRVREIIGIMNITKIPRAPEYVRGVINLRGKVNPVIDTRKKFGMPEVEDTERSCIIIVEILKEDTPVEMGMLVDSVSEVIDIPESDVEPAPEFGADIENQFIMGMAKTRSGVKILLDINKVLSQDSLEKLQTVSP